jgi:hypothetical protein
MGIRRKKYTLVGPGGLTLVSNRGFEFATNHLLTLQNKKTGKPVPGVLLTDTMGSLEIAKKRSTKGEG